MAGHPPRQAAALRFRMLPFLASFELPGPGQLPFGGASFMFWHENGSEVQV